jgi:hypothetical protein
VSTVRAETGQKVTLSGDVRDWIAAGSASPNETVRNAQGAQEISGPHANGNPTSTTAKGPFALNWTDGLSEPSGSGSRTWRTIVAPANGPESGVQIRVPASKEAAELTLYIGAEGADGQLRAKLSDRSAVSRTTLKSGSNGQGYVVTIRFEAGRAKQTLTVDLVGGAGGSVSFAAATLR